MKTRVSFVSNSSSSSFLTKEKPKEERVVVGYKLYVTEMFEPDSDKGLCRVHPSISFELDEFDRMMELATEKFRQGFNVSIVNVTKKV